MDFLSDKLLKRVEQGDLNALIKLDEHGLIMGPQESLADFSKRVSTLKSNIAEFRKDLDKESVIDFHGVRLNKDNEIPPKLFTSVAHETKEMWGFSIDWVPGYFTDDRMGILFAGCAMYSFENMFAVFVIRQSFKDTAKWFLYDRSELLSHELTHIAHLGFWTPSYEEYLAYQGSKSAFRRLIGGMFRRPRDTYMVLGALLLLMLYQVVNITVRDPLAIWSMPTPIAFAAALFPFAWLLGAYAMNRAVFRKAESRVCAAYGLKSALPVLFRCSEDEIRELAKLSKECVPDWVEGKSSDSPRWQLIKKRFLK